MYCRHIKMKTAFRRIKFILLQCAFATGIFAQPVDSTKLQHMVSFQLGFNQVKDENLHPKTSSGLASQVSYGFEKQKKHFHHFEFALAYSRLKTEQEELSKTVDLRLRLEYTLDFKVVDHPAFLYRLGPDIVLDYNGSFFPNWDDSHLYWADYLSIGIKNTLQVPFHDQREWRTTVAFPLFSVFSRPELYRLYKIDETDAAGIISNLNSDITAAHLTNVFHLRFQTEYRFPVFRQSRESLFYTFEWVRVRNDEGFPFQKLVHAIGIKFFL